MLKTCIRYLYPCRDGPLHVTAVSLGQKYPETQHQPQALCDFAQRLSLSTYQQHSSTPDNTAGAVATSSQVAALETSQYWRLHSHHLRSCSSGQSYPRPPPAASPASVQMRPPIAQQDYTRSMLATWSLIARARLLIPALGHQQHTPALHSCSSDAEGPVARCAAAHTGEPVRQPACMNALELMLSAAHTQHFHLHGAPVSVPSSAWASRPPFG